MKWNIQFDDSEGFIRAYQSGEFSVTDEALFLHEVFRSPEWKFGLPLMIDFCHLNIDNMRFAQVAASSGLMVQMADQVGPGKLALLCDDEEQFGLGRQFQMLTEFNLGREIRVYRDENEAIRFLTTARGDQL
jgi:hypothetical protein